MLIQVNEKRWLAEPEAVYWGKPDECWCNHMKDSAVHVESSSSFGHKWGSEYENQWVARMPSGTLEWLSDEEYERLIEVVPAKKLPGRHIKTLGLGARQLNMLLRDGVTSVEELERYSKRELQATRGIGKEGVAEIWKALGRHANDNNEHFLLHVGLGSGR